MKLVPWTERFCATIGARLRRSACAAVIAMQISPRQWVAMKLIFSGVTKSAAKMRSPSFSRSSSSTSTAMRPALRSAMRSVMGERLTARPFAMGIAILPSPAARRYGRGAVGLQLRAAGGFALAIDGRQRHRVGFCPRLLRSKPARSPPQSLAPAGLPMQGVPASMFRARFHVSQHNGEHMRNLFAVALIAAALGAGMTHAQTPPATPAARTVKAIQPGSRRSHGSHG